MLEVQFRLRLCQPDALETVLEMFDETAKKSFVAKFNAPTGRFAVAQEKQILVEFTDVEWIIPKQHDCTLNIRTDTLCMTKEGKSLEDTCMCNSSRRDEVCKAFDRDVTRSLESLHEKGYIFGDLQPGNILIVGKGIKTTAVLSDFESVRKIGPYSPTGAPGCDFCKNKKPCWRHAPLVLREGFFKEDILERLTAEFDWNSFKIVRDWLKSSKVAYSSNS